MSTWRDVPVARGGDPTLLRTYRLRCCRVAWHHQAPTAPSRSSSSRFTSAACAAVERTKGEVGHFLDPDRDERGAVQLQLAVFALIASSTRIGSRLSCLAAALHEDARQVARQLAHHRHMRRPLGGQLEQRGERRPVEQQRRILDHRVDRDDKAVRPVFAVDLASRSSAWRSLLPCRGPRISFPNSGWRARSAAFLAGQNRFVAPLGVARAVQRNDRASVIDMSSPAH